MHEKWRCIHGIWVSTAGRIKEPNSGHAYVPLGLSNGYRKVARDGKQYSVHRLVALAFLKPPSDPSYNSIDHKNKDKLDNRVSNLRWATKSEQNANRGKFRLAQNVIPIEANFGDGWQLFASAQVLVEKHGMSSACINHCLKGRNKSHRGAVFRYAQSDVIEGEVWSTALGHEVSNHGRVRSGDDRRQTVPYFPKPADSGYCFAFGTSVHILVALAFLPPPQSDAHTSIDHKNRNRSDNRAKNLRWATPKEQAANITQAAYSAPVRHRPVKAVHPHHQEQQFASIAEASRLMKVAPQGIQKAIAKGTNCGGWKWTRCD